MAKRKKEKKITDELRRARIEELKKEAAQLGGDFLSFVSKDCPPEVEEIFWQNVVEYERENRSGRNETLMDLLAKSSVELPAPELLEDGALFEKLWEVVDQLAAKRCYLYSTDHLSDRELYTQLWGQHLREVYNWSGDDPDAALHLDILGSGSEEDVHLYLKYYADEEWRRRWRSDFPDSEIPDHVDPDYDRDRFLPRPMRPGDQGETLTYPNIN